VIRVVAGILRDASQRVLLSERTGDSPFAGLWEFPGGKLEAGETPEGALQRELTEELGVTISCWSHLLQLTHHYDDRSVDINFFRVSAWSGIARGIEGQAIRWVHVDDLQANELLPADVPVIAALQSRSSSD